MDTSKIKSMLASFDWSGKNIVKGVVLAVLAVLALAVVIAILGVAWRVGFGGSQMGGMHDSYAYGKGGGGMGVTNMIDEGFMGMGRAVSGVAPLVPKVLSGPAEYYEADVAMDSIAGMPTPMPMYDMGGPDAEEYEHKSYAANYETRKFEHTCNAIEALKPQDYVVFTSSSLGERSCAYSFNVESTHTDDVVATLKALNPRDWDESSYTVERSVEDATSEIMILKRKLESVTETLAEAEKAYDAAMTQARNGADYSAIAQIVNSKISIIERLSQQKIAIQSQIDRYEKNLGRTTDQVEYTSFSVSVSKRVVIDWESIGNTWRYELDDFIMNINKALHHLTFGLMLLVVAVIRWIIYAGVILIAIRIVWQGGKRIILGKQA